MKAATVTLEVTEKELAYLMRVVGYPYAPYPSLVVKLGDAARDMREAKRERNRALKAERNEKRLKLLQEHPHPCAGDKCLNSPCCEDATTKEMTDG